ncbi:MAG TPA: hypothetical protein VNC21_16565 [Vicinamibacterales bacterium]|nr:hypothetical protein [Vicinamibacterales bacterium]
MSAVREAILLPILLLTVALLAGAEPGPRIALVPPSLFSLVLATMLIAALIRGGALIPARLLHGSRTMLANANGAIVLAALLLASAQVLAVVTPRSGVPLFFVDVLLFVQMLNTLVTQPDRVRLLRSLVVTLGSALILKFVVLSALSGPSTRISRVLVALFDVATFGSITQTPQPAAAGYIAFFAIVLYLIGVALLPAHGARDTFTGLSRAAEERAGLRPSD